MAEVSTERPDRAILISGGARGIGRGLARTFLQKGHRIYILDIDEAELSHTVKVHLKDDSGRVGSSLCNLRDIDDIKRKVATAAAFFGGSINVLINNGGIANPHWKDGKTMEDPESIREWQAYVETNLTAPFAVSQACIPYMKASGQDSKYDAVRDALAGPCIIHVGSFRAQQSDPNQEGYAATKAGLEGLTQSMAISCQRWGIRVNLIAPGRIKVAHECREADEKGLEWVNVVESEDVENHPTNRPGKVEDIAHAADYLIEAGFVTGQVITVDGGATKVKT